MSRSGDAVRVIFAGGGTGGHLYPGLAMRDALRETVERLDVLFVGARGGMEESILAGTETPLELLPGRGLRGASIGARLVAPFELAAAVVRSLAIIRSFDPDVVVGTGGYASAAVVVAAIIARVPRILQEQNSVAGLVNRRLARFADVVLLSFEISRRSVAGARHVVVTGNPLRRLPRLEREEAASRLGIDPALRTVLVIGGSRGAHSLNVAGSEAARVLLDNHNVQTILLTGRNDFDGMSSAWRGENRVKVMAYLDEVNAAYGAADVAVARAGASSVFELAAFGLPTVFVPYPWAADAHQLKNVETLEARGGCLVIDDDQLDGPGLAATLFSLLDDESGRADMRRVLEDWARPDAARHAAEEILSLIKKKTESRRARTLTRHLEGTC